MTPLSNEMIRPRPGWVIDDCIGTHSHRSELRFEGSDLFFFGFEPFLFRFEHFFEASDLSFLRFEHFLRFLFEFSPEQGSHLARRGISRPPSGTTRRRHHHESVRRALGETDLPEGATDALVAVLVALAEEVTISCAI